MFSGINTNFKPNIICHFIFFEIKSIIDLQCCNYGWLLSDSSSKEQSSMTIIHHRVVIIQRMSKMNELEVNWDNNIVNSFIKRVIKEFTIVT